MIAQPRSSQRYAGHKAERDRRLTERMVTLSRENPRLRLQASVGASEAGRLAGQQEAGASAVAQGRSQSAPEAMQEAAPSDGRE